MERFGSLGVEGSDLIDQISVRVVGGQDGVSMASIGVVKENLVLVVSVVTRVAIARRVSRF